MFVSFEGIDGCGKSTQVRLLTLELERRGFKVCRVREPGGTPLGETIRTWLLDPNVDTTPRAELLLFSAARAHLVDTVVEPALREGEIVIADRFYDSTSAYQGVGRGIADLDWLDAFHQFVVDKRVPNRTYLLDIDSATARVRVERRPVDDRIESAGDDFFKRAVSGYRTMAAAHPARILKLDATLKPEAIHELILADLIARIA